MTFSIRKNSKNNFRENQCRKNEAIFFIWWTKCGHGRHKKSINLLIIRLILNILSCPTRVRTWTLLIQSQSCCQLHHWAIDYGCKNTLFLNAANKKRKKIRIFFDRQRFEAYNALIFNIY